MHILQSDGGLRGHAIHHVQLLGAECAHGVLVEIDETLHLISDQKRRTNHRVDLLHYETLPLRKGRIDHCIGTEKRHSFFEYFSSHRTTDSSIASLPASRRLMRHLQT